MHSRNSFIGRIVALFICLVLLAIPVTAQGVLTYGGGASGTLSATAPLSFYSFTGNADDLVSIQVLAITSELQPTVALNAPNQQQLAFNAGDPFNPGIARINYQLPQTGLYTILVSGNGTIGDFAIRLDGSVAPPSTDVSDDGEAQSTLDADNPAQVFSVQASPDAPTTVTINSDTSGFEYIAVLRNSTGQTIATFIGSDTQSILATLPQGNQTYDIEVRPLIVGTQGDIQITVGLVAVSDTADTPDAPNATEDATALPTDTEEVDNACTVTNTGDTSINIRSGASTDFGVVDTFAPNTSRDVLGVNSPAGWYQIALENGGSGWVFGDIVTFNGDCSQLPEVDDQSQDLDPTEVAPNQVQQATPTFTPSYTPTISTAGQQQNPTATQPAPTQQQQNATATFTPSYTPTTQQQATATFTPSYTPTTPPPPPVAPADARFNSPLNITLDSTISITDFVSYPDGDTEDRVRWDITGMNSNSSLPGGRARLIISVSCFGTNTNQIEFFTGGQTYSCGSTIVDREVTFDSKTGSVVITAVGGEGTYVQWVLTGTATRIND